jgi:hypothetical protein
LGFAVEAAGVLQVGVGILPVAGGVFGELFAVGDDFSCGGDGGALAFVSGCE